MKTFNISKVSKMGEPHETYGQAFWAEVQEQLEPVKFNLMQGDVKTGDTITCEEVLLKESHKGTAYHQLKKVKVVSSGVAQPTATKFEAGNLEHKLDQILELARENNDMLKSLVEPTVQEHMDMPEDFLRGSHG